MARPLAHGEWSLLVPVFRCIIPSIVVSIWLSLSLSVYFYLLTHRSFCLFIELSNLLKLQDPGLHQQWNQRPRQA